MKPVAQRAWAAMMLPPFAWFLGQQSWGQAARLACREGTLGLAIGVATLLLCWAGAVVAWPLRRADEPTRSIAWCAIGNSGLFSLALAYHLLAGSLIPSCWA